MVHFKKENIRMNTQQVDALVIGFGKGGKTLAAFLAQKGWEVAVVEQSKQMYGGTCINIACIPSKSLSNSAQQAARCHFETHLEKLDAYQNAVEDKENVVSFLRQANYTKLHQNPHVTIIDGMASFLSPYEIRVDLAGSGQLLIEAKHIFINTGTLPSLPPITGFSESKRVYTSTSMMDQSRLPEKLVIIGGGHIGLEFAAMYTAFGSNVTVLHRGDLFLSDFDRDVADAAKSTLEKQGIYFHLRARILQIADRGERTSITYVDGTQTQHVLEANAVLLATGRVPNTQHLDLAKAGIEVDNRGFIKVDEFPRAPLFQTSGHWVISMVAHNLPISHWTIFALSEISCLGGIARNSVAVMFPIRSSSIQHYPGLVCLKRKRGVRATR